MRTGIEVTLFVVRRGRSEVLPVHRQELYRPGVVEVRVHCYLVDAPAGWEPTLHAEHDGHRWCAPAEAAATLRWPATADALRRLLDT